MAIFNADIVESHEMYLLEAVKGALKLEADRIKLQQPKIKKEMVSKSDVLNAIRGCHSLCGDVEFFGEVEKIIKGRMTP
jgi:hypothetical protein